MPTHAVAIESKLVITLRRLVVVPSILALVFSLLVPLGAGVNEPSDGGLVMANSLTRRQFLVAAGVAATVPIINTSGSPTREADAAQVSVRRDIGGMDASDPILVSYRAAIKKMKASPATDARSWTYQAAIHGTLLTPYRPAWNTCQHGNYFFWSWHRMYLYWFERIVRKLSDDRCWTLPYWNWTSPNERQLPAPFRDPASELYTPNRHPAMNNGTGTLPSGDVNYSLAFALTNFTSASASLEATPHGAVHVDVGGWMGSVPTAAQDPIFYLHHCNIDRLWNLWLAQGGGRTDPLGDLTWRNQKFTFFNENGSSVQMTGCAVLRAAEQLRYVYEGEPPQVKLYCLPKVVRQLVEFKPEVLIPVPVPPITLTAEPTTFAIDIREAAAKMEAFAKSKTETLLLVLEEVEAERQPEVVWDVYVGLAADAMPDSESPHFVGTLSLFGTGIRSEMKEKFQPGRFVFPLDQALAASFEKHPEQVPVRLIPHGILIEGKPSRPEVKANVRIGRVNILVERE